MYKPSMSRLHPANSRNTNPLKLVTVAVYMDLVKISFTTVQTDCTTAIPENNAPCWSGGVICDMTDLMTGLARKVKIPMAGTSFDVSRM